MTNSIILLYGINFIIQVCAFIPAYFLQTEKFYDLIGSATHILIVCLAYSLVQVTHPRPLIQASCIILWGLRLGLFLFARVHSHGDRRFKEIKMSGARFLMVWIMQGIWVGLNLFPSLLCITNTRQPSLRFRDYAGWGMWLFGFLIEVVADMQKSSFRNNPINNKKFISHGLWSLSRHPNYFGEIMLWYGLYLSSSSTFTGYQYFSMLCPTLVYFLITRVSGIPPLENRGFRLWGQLPQYKEYVRNTPVLVPFWNWQ